MSGRLRVERVYPHPPELVWRTLTEAELLSRWLMPNDFVAEVGHRFTFTTEPGPGFDGKVHCEVLLLEAPRRMTWSWRGGPLDTTVTFALEPIDGGRSTRLVVLHDGFRGLKSRLVQLILGIGNRTLYGKKLPAVLDQLAAPGAPPESDSPDACMSPWQRLLILLARIVPGRRRAERRP